jgi:hypothetical protein
MGTLRLTDRQERGTRPGTHDLEADLPGGAIAAMEVTSVNEPQRLRQEAAATQVLSSLTIPRSNFKWMVGLDGTARVKYINQDDLRRLLTDMEAQGARRAQSRASSGEPFVERLRKLKIAHVYAFEAPGRGGKVIFAPDFYFARGWDGTATNTWLAEFLASPKASKKLTKLRRADHAAERHPVIMLHPISQPGLGIPSGLTDDPDPGSYDSVLPSLTPPAPLTDLWTIPMYKSWKGLRWSQGNGWTVLPPAVTPV